MPRGFRALGLLAALALAITFAGAAQASPTHNGGLPDWAAKAFEKVN